MSAIIYDKNLKVIMRTGEYYEVGSCYKTPRHIGITTIDQFEYMTDKLIFFRLFSDVDELTNKPRRFFDHMLSLVEYMRDKDPMLDVGNRREYWNNMVEGCEMWLSAVERGLYGEVQKLAIKREK